MSTFEDERYQWRETYFVLFDPSKKPLLTAILHGLAPVFKSLDIRQSQTDAEGQIESLSVASYNDRAAIDIVYQSGEHVVNEMDALAEEMLQLTSTKKNRAKIEKARRCSARLEVLHFEQMEPIEIPNENAEREFTFTDLSAKTLPKPVKQNLFGNRPKFQFDAKQYIPPAEPIQSLHLEDADSPNEADPGEADPEQDEMDPNTLILVLELLCRLTDGVAIDPSAGAVL